MSEPPNPSAAKAAPAKSPPPRRRGRARDTAALLLLVVASAGVLVSASPAVLRAAGIGAPPPDPYPHDERLKLPHPPAGTPAHPIFAPDEEDDDEPRMTEFERQYPDGMWPGRRTPEEKARERELFQGLSRDPADKGRPGLTRKPLRLLEDPHADASALAVIRAGEPVQILKEAGEWILVRYKGGDGAITGWAKKNEIAVR